MAADAQTLRQVAQTRTPFSTWLGVVLLFMLIGLLVLAVGLRFAFQLVVQPDDLYSIRVLGAE